MAISRWITLLVSSGILVCALIFAVATYGFSSIENEVLHGTAAGGPAGESLQQAIASVRMVMIGVLVTGLALLGGVAFLFARALARQLASMTAVISSAADRLDFTESSAPLPEDEIGQALQAYGRLLARLRNSFISIQEDVAKLTEVTEGVDQSSRNIARNSKVQSDASTNMASAVEQMTASIARVADQADEASKHTQESREIAEQSANVILSTVNCIQQISETVREAAGRIKALRADCDSIASMAQIIREIADQTNLLALNAAIEAARAGEQGRGFAVVADEVRKLAERTTHSTQEINGLLVSMQESARLAVDSMSNTERAVDDGVVHAREAGESIQQIKTGAEAAASVMAEISSAMREQETSSVGISRNIEQIARMSEQNASAATNSAAGVSRMTEVELEMAQNMAAYRVTTASKKIVLRSADIFAEDQPAVQAVQAMADLLEKRTDGRITLKVISGGVFGTGGEAVKQVKSGLLDMTRVNIATFNKECPATVVPSLPFIFGSVDHLHRVLDAAPGQEILDACADAGCIGLAFYEGGTHSIYSTQPIRTVTDMRGRKFRVMLQSDLWNAIAEAMGAKAMPMAQDGITPSVRAGLIDTAENNLLVFDSYKHHEDFKYYCMTEHSMAPDILVFSKKRWNTLAEEDRAIIAQAARESVDVMRRLWREKEEAARTNAAVAGVNFVKNVDKNAFRNAMRPVYDRFVTSAQQKALFQAIVGMK